MKEATGELNLTVIIVIAVAGLVAFFSFTIWPVVNKGIHNNNDCSNAICTCQSQNCREEAARGYYTNCTIKGSNDTIDCPYKG